MKRCSKCSRTLPHEQFFKDRSTPDGLTWHCRDCKLASVARYRATPAGKASKARHRVSAKGKAGQARRGARYRATPKGKAAERRYYASPLGRAAIARGNAKQETKIRKARFLRRKWQRSGSGVHMARIQDWREFFDGLASDAERCIAAHVLEFFAGVDDRARTIFADRDFDYEYLADHFDIGENAT